MYSRIKQWAGTSDIFTVILVIFIIGIFYYVWTLAGSASAIAFWQRPVSSMNIGEFILILGFVLLVTRKD